MRFFKLCLSFIICLLLVFSFTFPCFAEETSYVWSNNTEAIPTNASIENTENSLELESGAAILMEQTTGKILYEHNMHEKLRPASVTKIMSILLIMEQIDSGKLSLTDEIPYTENA